MSIYVLAPNNVVETYPYTLTDMILANPEVSFSTSVSDETAARFSVYPVVETTPPTYDPITENLIWTNPDLIDSVWVQTWSVEQASPEDIAEREAQAKVGNKTRASELLSQTDWTEMLSVSDPANIPYLQNVDAFVAYRVELRAIAVNPPVTVDPWPIKPDEVWA